MTSNPVFRWVQRLYGAQTDHVEMDMLIGAAQRGELY